MFKDGFFHFRRFWSTRRGAKRVFKDVSGHILDLMTQGGLSPGRTHVICRGTSKQSRHVNGLSELCPPVRFIYHTHNDLRLPVPPLCDHQTPPPCIIKDRQPRGRSWTSGQAQVWLKSPQTRNRTTRETFQNKAADETSA